MSCKLFFVSCMVSVLAVSAFSEQERVIRVQNHLRFGYDDNIYLNSQEVDSPEIIDVLNISAKINFSSRTDAVFSYQPEVRYRTDSDADPDTVTFHDIYGKLNHAVSQRTFLTVSDRMRYQERDGQSGAVNATDQNYFENDLMGSLDFTVNSLSSIILGGGYNFRIWDDDVYGEYQGNNYDMYKGSASYFREIRKETTKGMVGVDYMNLEYDGSRGEVDSVTLMTGADNVFNPNWTGFGRVGASMSSVDTQNGSEDQTTPYLDAGLEYNPSDRTSINGNVGYSIYQSQNSLYNAQDRTSLGLGIRHDLTAKISLASTLTYIMSQYNADYRYLGGGTEDIDDEWLQFNLRASYQINRNNFAEIGYEFSDRSVDNGSLVEYSRNRFDIGWRLRL